MAKAAHVPTDKSRTLAKQLSAIGVTYEDIAIKLGICADTLTKYYRAELDFGRIDAIAGMATSMYEQGRAGNFNAAKYWLGCRAGWKETTAHELSGPNGEPLEMVCRWSEG